MDNAFHALFFGREKVIAVSELDCRNTPASEKEVAMSKKAYVRIEVEAAKSLIHWKWLFADEVAARARQLAEESSQPGLVTLSHYRQAALIAVRALSAAILDGGPSSEEHKAA